MNYKMIGRFLAQIVAVEAVFLLPALGISLGHGEVHTALAFCQTLAIMAIVGGGLWLLCRKAGKLFGAKEGMVCVSLSWALMSVLGCLPFVLSGQIPRFIDALFETVSGFTTTGASVLADVEALSKGLLYWRSFSHWVGGMGVLVFLLAISPSDGQGKGFTMHLLRAESPGPDVGKLVPKMKKTATILYMIYIVMTVVCFVFLLLGNMDALEALCTAFGTAGTGGFGVRNDSMASYSPYIQNVCSVFMFLFGVNFSCYYLLLLGKLRGVFKDEELRLYMGIALGTIVLIVLNIRPLYGTLEETIRHAAFQVSSIMTTTGFATTDFDLWPAFSKGLLLMLMVVGACAGSTGGGLKCARVLLLFKSLRRNIRQVLYPKKVQVVRTNGRVVNETVLDNTNAYLAAYIIILILSVLLVARDGYSIGTNLSAVLACFNNIGPGMELVGPTCNYAHFGLGSKLVLIIDMLAGRLEIFPMLILLSRSTWKDR
ncbi:MAG: TrkH family potassium uptake protein [Oscillospiraceae bacterium]|nr:TrkH family potassium uptake protein [Oscillospiraceae bacterium]